MIICYNNDLLASYFGNKKTKELIARKYFWFILYWDVEIYVKSYNVYLASKAIYHKSYKNILSLPIFTHYSKNLFIDFVMDVTLLMDWKSDNYNAILVVVDCLTKIVYYKPVKTIVDIAGLVEVIINVIVRHYDLWESNIIYWSLFFISKFWFCYATFLVSNRSFLLYFIYK